MDMYINDGNIIKIFIQLEAMSSMYITGKENIHVQIHID